MKWILITLFGVMQTVNVHASLVQQPINDNYSLVHQQSSGKKTDRSGFFTLALEYQGHGIGLAKDVQLSDAWRGSFGIMFSDDYVDVETSKSVVNLQGRLFDINELLSVRARLKFSDIMPYVSLSYQYKSGDNLVLDIMTSLKIFTVQSSYIQLSNPLGDLLQDVPEVKSALQQELNAELEDFYVYPVIDIRFKYAFN